MKKIVLLGGAGAMGAITLKDLVETSDFEVVVADYNREAAEAVAAAYASARVTAAHADVRDRQATAKLLNGSFAVINSVQYQLNLEVMEAALLAGCHYTDLGGLFHMTVKQLELHQQFLDKDLLALIGMGAAPGTTNLLARMAADEMDEVHEIHCQVAGIDLNAAEAEGGLASSYSIQTILEEASKPAAVFTGGKMTFVEPMSGGVPVDFGPPVGLQSPAFTIHSEVATLPTSYASKGLQECTFAIAFHGDFTSKLRFLREIGVNSLEPVAVRGQTVVPQEVLLAVLNRQPKPAPDTRPPNQVEVVRSLVRGLRGGKKVGVNMDLYVTGIPEWGMGSDVDTGCPPSVGIQMLARGEITGRGVLPPELCVPVEPYFQEMAKRKMVVRRSDE
ncbi:MAG: saccharopine dehydrogenase NADP-binding domain-containing protein [Candidatus Eremiobacteraeota bacterium]|nr:saccharopine dehydrogenase NADP-binding domain-containing protein [Candidatus Eremiobacteraeota bacterium]MCW5871396.1 saccharopine dehydrogenase NADP-binding domain-containing protein [Candidatus Eremiobacteraeota bacterium]